MRYRPLRKSCDVPVVILTPDGEVAARVTSVSSTGARVQGARRLRRDMVISVSVNGMELPGRIAWVSDDRAGVEFDRPQTRGTLRAAGLRND